ncbi:unnamed protein product [Nippostrongylus brasiliensis]|uniref:Uncharacterized protein n=1 Tax=Nippostrongylus brasiliensis TaxID=27835 RepID=A0A0N4YE48_NIPBR|nr:unnamed protein product [Nippostrongylus brasiliensis]
MASLSYTYRLRRSSLKTTGVIFAAKARHRLKMNLRVVSVTVHCSMGAGPSGVVVHTVDDVAVVSPRSQVLHFFDVPHLPILPSLPSTPTFT